MGKIVRMYIDKFKGEVLIEEDHPLAVAQREKDALQPGAPAADLPDVPLPPAGAEPPVQGVSKASRGKGGRRSSE